MAFGKTYLQYVQEQHKGKLRPLPRELLGVLHAFGPDSSGGGSLTGTVGVLEQNAYPLMA